MLILLKTMIVIFTFEMCFVKCVWSNHYVFLLQLLHSTMHIYLQNRCTNFSKQRIQKKLYTLEKRKGEFHFGGQGYHVHFARQYILQLDQYVCNTIFLLKTTYTMKRELYTKNENSRHKNDDFCKKNTKNTPK